MSRISLLFFLVVVLGRCELYAADVLDQFNVVPASPNVTVDDANDHREQGQAVRAGLTGILSRVELGLFREADLSGPLFVDIVRVKADVPSFAVADRLATRSLGQNLIPLLSFPDYYSPTNNVSVDFSSSGLHFNAGDLFGIVLRSDVSNQSPGFGYSWWVTTADSYPRGEWYTFNYAINGVLSRGGADTQFATYVLVPEPTSTALIAFAAMIFGSRRRRVRP